MNSNYVIIGSPSKYLYGKCIDSNNLNGNLDSNMDYSKYWNRPEYTNSMINDTAINSGYNNTRTYSYSSIVISEHLEDNTGSNNYNTISKKPFGRIYQHVKLSVLRHANATIGTCTAGQSSSDFFNKKDYREDKSSTSNTVRVYNSGNHKYYNQNAIVKMNQIIAYRPLFKIA